ncbi:MAG: M48 family metalloprotease [Candidatus Lokiarchaeota archaeon]|nr:M48 family metalloprotease [Candidatus Lokiarchaeota archaeon]
MKESRRTLLFGIYSFLLIAILGLFTFFKFLKPGFFTISPDNIQNIIISVLFLVLFGLMVNELFHWKKQGKRSDAFDLVLLGFIFITIYLATFDPMNSVIGAFGIFIIFGAYELREYEVLNKLLVITAVTYNVIFFAGLINSILHEFGLLIVEGDKNWIIRDTAFSFAIWIILILGFALFGRKYIVVLRFMSPEYLTMFLYIFSWLAVRGLSFIWQESINEDQQRNLIYLALFLTNWFVYSISGPVLDLMLGIKRVPKQIKNIESQLEKESDPKVKQELEQKKKQYIGLQELVEEVSKNVKITDRVKVGFAQYPILNAMAYGAFFDKRIAIISKDINEIPRDELKGVVAHELHHAKGLDTLILSIISSVQLVIFWLLKWPATYYDYVFGGDQPFEIWVFILINLGITLVIYVFIRILEGRADMRTKQSGYANELAKGLYNLEGFYSSGREIGLDTMLLSEEKLIEYNRVENYSTTAQYLDRNMLNPKPLTLLSNLMNSHPPSYLRILAMYDEENQIKPARESILPFLLMAKGYRMKFARNLKSAHKSYRIMANRKFKSMFGIKDYANFLNDLNKKEVFELMLGKTYLHVDSLNFIVGIGELKEIRINDEVCEPYSYLFSPKEITAPSIDKEINEIEEIIRFNKNETSTKRETYTLQPETTKLIELDFGAIYQLSKSQNARLVTVSIDPQLYEKLDDVKDETVSIKKRYRFFRRYLKKFVLYYFVDEKNELVKKKYRYKIKFNLNSIQHAEGKQIFLQERGTLQLLHLREVQKINGNYDYILKCETETGNARSYPLKEIIVKKDEFGLQFHNPSEFFQDEIKILHFLKERHTRTTIYLKKAINSVETGYISSLVVDSENAKPNSFLVLNNIHGKKIEIPLRKIETLVFSVDTIGIMNKSKMSLAERFMQKILYWTKPDQVYVP